MKRLKFPILIVVLLGIAGGVYFAAVRQPREIVLTGIVTTDEVIVSSEIQGRIQNLFVKEGDVVSSGKLLAVIEPQELQQDVKYYASNNEEYGDQVAQAQADLEYARLTYQRDEPLYKTGAVSEEAFDQARTNYDGAKARVESLKKQVDAAAAQEQKARVQLGYTQIVAPLDGIVDTRAALQNEVVNPGQPIVTLINQDDLWVRADVEETYIDRIRLGDTLPVTFPSGLVRPGVVFYRGVDADYATQRDVSRTKRDIRTFEIRLRCDNADRRLAVGMTAYVALPVNDP